MCMVEALVSNFHISLNKNVFTYGNHLVDSVLCFSGSSSPEVYAGRPSVNGQKFILVLDHKILT